MTVDQVDEFTTSEFIINYITNNTVNPNVLRSILEESNSGDEGDR